MYVLSESAILLAALFFVVYFKNRVVFVFLIIYFEFLLLSSGLICFIIEGIGAPEPFDVKVKWKWLVSFKLCCKFVQAC